MAVIDDFDDEEERKQRAAAGAPEFSYETIQADPWTAVYFGIPRTADAALLRYAYDATMQCCGSSIGPGGEVTELNFERAVRRLDELDSRLPPAMLDDEAERQAPERQPATPEKEPLTVEAIERDPWTAVHHDIPPDASRDLLLLVATTARDLHQILAECRDAAGNGRAIDRETLPEYLRDLADMQPQILTVNEMLDLGQKAADRREDAEYRLLKFDQRTSEPVPEKEPMTAEAIERDPWAAVDRDIPEDANRELLSLIVTTAYELRGVEREGQEDLGFDPAEERHKEASDLLRMLDMRKAAAAPEFSHETIKADWWTAVYLPIPQAADPALLAHAQDVAGWVREGLEVAGPDAGGVYEPSVIGSDYSRADNIEHASARIAELNERLELARAQETAAEKDHIKEELLEREPLESARLKMADFAFGAIFDALESGRDAAQSQSRDAGDEISRPLGAAELAERVRRILENPILADAERDDRVLQAVEERREELGLVEAAKSDDAREVESSQEPEPEASADRDAAEIDYLFGKEEMTEARAAAYDRFTGQELSPRAGQTAGAVQDVGQSQSQSQSKGRSR